MGYSTAEAAKRVAETAKALMKTESSGKGGALRESSAVPFLIAIDGRCAAGKTTLAEELEKKEGWSVFHTDHFFPRPEQRTSERLSAAGGNFDRERFLEEVVLPLKSGEKIIRYRPFDCRTGTLLKPVEVKACDICLVEGSYSCHPELWTFYGLHVFLTVGEEEQLSRIVKRNGAEKARDFKERWIPMEEKYFSAYDIEKRCEIRFSDDI